MRHVRRMREFRRWVSGWALYACRLQRAHAREIPYVHSIHVNEIYIQLFRRNMLTACESRRGSRRIFRKCWNDAKKRSDVVDTKAFLLSSSAPLAAPLSPLSNLEA